MAARDRQHSGLELPITSSAPTLVLWERVRVFGRLRFRWAVCVVAVPKDRLPVYPSDFLFRWLRGKHRSQLLRQSAIRQSRRELSFEL